MMTGSALPRSVLLVGCGRMGGALLCGWHGHLPVHVLDPAAADLPQGARRIVDPGQVRDLPSPTLIVLAVKPSLVAEVLAVLRPFLDASTPIVSAAAGIRLETLAEGTGPLVPVARAMPNIAVELASGATTLFFGARFTHAMREHACALFGLVGEAMAVDEEAQIDTATALAGSGPAYFFRFAEAMVDAGEAAGLPRTTAQRLVEATLRGSGALCNGRSIGELREMVTSPGGTTAAALAALEEDAAIDRLLRKAVDAALRRAQELAS